MSEFWTVLGAVVPVFLITGAGFILRRLNWLTAEADQSMLRLTINLLLPCLILDAALGNAALAQWRNLVLAPLVGAGTFAVGMLVCGRCAGLAGLKDDRARRTFALTAGLYNYAFVPIPLALLLFGQQTVGVLFVHNLGVEFALWTLGVTVIAGGRAHVGLKRIINAPWKSSTPSRRGG
jgi:malate permease and related proteins